MIWQSQQVEQVRDIVFDKEDEYIILDIPDNLLNNLNDDEQTDDNKSKPDNNDQSSKPAKPVYIFEGGVVNFDPNLLEEDKEGYN